MEADCLYALGFLAWGRADHVAALACHGEALPLYEALGDTAGEAKTLSGLGMAHMAQDDVGRALPCYLGALNRCERLGDVAGVGASLINIGNVYTALEDRTQALDYYSRSLDISRRTGKTASEARCLCNLTSIYLEMGRVEEARESGRAALALARRCGYRHDECYALTGQGLVRQAAGENVPAAAAFREALVIALSLSDRLNECRLHLLLGEALLGAGAREDARASLGRAAEMAEDLGLRQFLFPALLGLSQVCKAEGDFAPALAYYERFHALEKEALGDNADRRLQALRVQMDVEGAQKEAEAHRLESVELAQANRALRRAGEDKEQLVEELRAQADELERQASQDGLTGLYNRRYLEGWLARAFHQAKQGGGRLTVALLDVDHFKQINDRFGHQVGDEVLTALSRLLRRVCREGDIVARYGGEEFLLALPGASASQARRVCERARRGIEAHPWREVHPALSVTASLGFSGDLSAPDHERLLSLADGRLYEAKRRGRNRVCGQAPPLPSA